MKGDSMHCCYREQVAYAFYARFQQPKLYKLAQSGDWDEIPARCRSHPKEAFFVNKYAPNDTPLHRLLRYDCARTLVDDEITLETMEDWKKHAVTALLEANKDAPAAVDAFGRTPLHLVCSGASFTRSSSSLKQYTSDSVSEMAAAIAIQIVQAYPEAVSVQDHVDKRTPLHYLLARNDAIPLPLLRLLISSSPSAVRTKDVTKETPLDIAQRRKDEISNAAQVLDIIQEADRLPKLAAVPIDNRTHRMTLSASPLPAACQR